MFEWKHRIKAAASAMGVMAMRTVFPPLCMACDAEIETHGAVCGECWRLVYFLDRPWCAALGTPLAEEMADGFLSGEALANPPLFQRARAAVLYAGPARTMVHRLKYQDRADLAPSMARWMARAGFELLADADLILPAPLHRWRFLRRRYNQSAELARVISRIASRPFVPGVLERLKPTQQQVGLGREQRLKNVRGAFRITPQHKGDVRGKRILLVDDVFTTGATASAMTRVLLRGGAKSVDVLTFAQVPAGDFLKEEEAPI